VLLLRLCLGVWLPANDPSVLRLTPSPDSYRITGGLDQKNAIAKKRADRLLLIDYERDVVVALESVNALASMRQRIQAFGANSDGMESESEWPVQKVDWDLISFRLERPQGVSTKKAVIWLVNRHHLSIYIYGTTPLLTSSLCHRIGMKSPFRNNKFRKLGFQPNATLNDALNDTMTKLMT